jgi:hypothetical protein
VSTGAGGGGATGGAGVGTTVGVGSVVGVGAGTEMATVSDVSWRTSPLCAVIRRASSPACAASQGELARLRCFARAHSQIDRCRGDNRIGGPGNGDVLGQIVDLDRHRDVKAPQRGEGDGDDANLAGQQRERRRRDGKAKVGRGFDDGDLTHER